MFITLLNIWQLLQYPCIPGEVFSRPRSPWNSPPIWPGLDNEMSESFPPRQGPHPHPPPPIYPRLENDMRSFFPPRLRPPWNPQPTYTGLHEVALPQRRYPPWNPPWNPPPIWPGLEDARPPWNPPPIWPGLSEDALRQRRRHRQAPRPSKNTVEDDRDGEDYRRVIK